MRRRIQMTVIALAALMLSGGCGEEAYDLTEQEESLIVNYSAHVVAKYNRYQSEGLKYVDPEEASSGEEEPTEIPEETESAREENTETAQGTGTGEADSGEAAAEPVLQTATLDDLFGSGGLRITYSGAELADSYLEDDYFAMYPDEGYRYLVMKLAVANDGSDPVSADVMSAGADFAVTVNGEYAGSALTTMLTEDFSGYSAVIGAGESKETVLIFQVPATVTAVNELELVVHTDEDYQIML